MDVLVKNPFFTYSLKFALLEEKNEISQKGFLVPVCPVFLTLSQRFDVL